MLSSISSTPNNEPYPWEETDKCRQCQTPLNSSNLNYFFCSTSCEQAYYPEKRHVYDKEYIAKRINEWRQMKHIVSNSL